MTSTDGSGITTVAERSPRWFAIFETLIIGAVVALAPSDKFPHQVKHVPKPGAAAYLALVTIAVIVGCFRGWRMGLSMDQRGATVRNYFRSYQIGWPEVSRLADGSAYAGADGWKWALNVMLRDGRTVTANGTMASRPQRAAEVVAIIKQGADRYAIPAELTGNATRPGTRWFLRLALLALILVASWLGWNG